MTTKTRRRTGYKPPAPKKVPTMAKRHQSKVDMRKVVGPQIYAETILALNFDPEGVLNLGGPWIAR